jgi:hypothetical protein
MPPIYVLLTLSCYTRTFEMEMPYIGSLTAQPTRSVRCRERR